MEGLSLNRPYRVLCLFTIMNRGGAETMCMNLYRHIDRSKVQFDFLVYHKERGSYEDEIELMGGHIYRVPHLKYLVAHIMGARAFFSAHKEFIVVHNHMQSNGSFICQEARRAGIDTIIYHSHSGPVPLFGNSLKVDIRRICNSIINKIALKNSTDYFACGETAATAIPGQCKPIIIIRNAIDLDLFKYNFQVRNRVRRENGCRDKLIIGNVARFDANKNQIFAIEILEQLIKKGYNAELWLVGDGTLKEQIERKTRERGLNEYVRFFGVRTDVNELLQAMDVYLFPSVAEGLPVACIEAQAAGLPCVFSDGFDSHTVVTDNCKVLSLKRSPEEWATEILKMAARPRTDKTKMVRQAGYDIKDTAKFLQNFYLSKATVQYKRNSVDD